METEKLKVGLPAGVKRVELENGLVLILKEDHSSPVATVHAWAKVGSVNEGEWMGAGMSHVLEHLLFKGTTTRPGSRIDQEVQAAGGQMNACTSFNYTLYYIDIPSKGVQVAVDILCDIMQNATLPAEELEKERQVILREMDMGQDDPDRKSSRRLFEVAYQVSPYRHPVIGYKDIFEKFTRDDLLAYYRKMYAPNNLFFVVVGDIDPEAVEKQVRSAFSKARRGALEPQVLPVEPPQVGMRRVEECGAVELCRTHIAWHVPDALHPDIPALGVISAILGSGRSSRLFQKVREEKGLVQSVDSWVYAPGEQGLIGISAEIESEKYERALKAIFEEVERLKAELVSVEELEKVKKQCIVALQSTRKTMSGQALDMGSSWLAARDLQFSARNLEQIQQLTPQDVQRIAQTWFNEQNEVLYSLLPEAYPLAEKGLSSASTQDEVQKVTLPGGLRLLVKRDNRLPFVEMRMVFQGGLMAEKESSNGSTLMLSRLMLKGTRSRKAEEISEQIENVGGKIDNWVSHGSFGFSLEVLREDLGVGLDILSDVVLNPVFPEDALAVEREMLLADIRAEKDQMLQYTLRKMLRELFGACSFGLSSLGNEASVKAMTQGSVKAEWSRLVRPANAVLSIFGDVDAEAVIAAVKKQFASWPAGKSVELCPPAVFKSGMRRIGEKQDKKQVVVVVGYPGVSFSDPRIYPLVLLQEGCSDLGSRLFLRIRDELALAYYVGAYQQCGVQPGYFCFYAGTEPGKEEQVVEEIFKQAADLRQGGLSEEELSRAKAKLMGQRYIARQDIGEVARVRAINELVGLGYDFAEKEDDLLQAVTLKEVQTVAEQILDPERCVVSIVGGGES